MDTLHKLVEAFAENVHMQNLNIESGNAANGNKCARKYIKAFRDIVAHGDEGREALAGLFNDPRADVRVMAACFLLKYRHSEARAILEKAARGDGLVALGASEALKRWDEGTWSLDM
ncbi:MAG: DUF2019 domain-containing protein [Spirochaetes bacterium]|jgi:hypothetical protein|nr:DUF2019 domain-containing protein [Spirochaetota bacterium]